MVIKFSVFKMSGTSQSFYAETTKHPDTKSGYKGIEITAHCLQCAKSELLMKDPRYDVDLRGSHANLCGIWLKGVVQDQREQHRRDKWESEQ